MTETFFFIAGGQNSMRQSATNLGQLMTDIPADDGSQITGRIFALEIILRQLLETHPDIENFLNETDARLDRQEAALLKAAPTRRGTSSTCSKAGE